MICGQGEGGAVSYFVFLTMRWLSVKHDLDALGRVLGKLDNVAIAAAMAAAAERPVEAHFPLLLRRVDRLTARESRRRWCGTN